MPAERPFPCPECRKRNDPAASACAHCGHPFLVFCACGTELSIRIRKCPACGRRHGAEQERRWWDRPRRIGLAVLLLLLVTAGVVFGLRRFLSGRVEGSDVLLRQARAELAEENWAAAGDALRRCLREGGEHPEPLFLLGVVQARLGREEEAAAVLRRAIDLDPAHASARLLLADLDLRADRDAEANANLDVLLAGTSPPARAHVLAARLRLRPGFLDPVAAEENLRLALSSDAPDEDALLLLARVLCARLDRDGAPSPDPEAVRHLRRARDALAARRRAGDTDPRLAGLAARIEIVLDEPLRVEEILAPDDPEAGNRLLLARARWSRGARDEAGGIVDDLLANATDPAALLDLHGFLLAAGDEKRATGALAKVEELAPADPRAALAGVMATFRAGDAGEAERRARAAHADHPEDGPLAVALVEIIEADGRAEEALELLRELAADPEAGDLVRLKRADGLLSRPSPSAGEIEEAEGHLAAASTGDGRDEYAWRMQLAGRLALVLDRPREAVDRLRAAAFLRPADARNRVLLATAHRRLGERALEAEELSAAIAIAGETSELLRARSRALLAAGRATAANRDASRAWELDPDVGEGLVQLARTLLDRPDPDLEGAISLLRDARRRDDPPEGASALLARALVAAGRLDEAQQELADAIRGSPTKTEELALRELLAALAGPPGSPEWIRAMREVYEEFLAAHPGHAPASASLARVLVQTGAFAPARAVLEAAIERNPRSSPLYRLLAETWLETDAPGGIDRARAEAAANRVAELAPGGPDDRCLRARFATLDEDWTRAAEEAGEALRLAPRDAVAATILGLARLRLGQADGARAALRIAIEEQPSLSLARRLLAEITFRDAIARIREGDPSSAVGLLDEAEAFAPSAGGIRQARLAALLLVARAGDREVLARTRTECEARIAEIGEPATAPETEELRTCLILLGELNHALGDDEAFLAATRRHVEVAPDDPLARARVGIALIAAGREEEGRRSLLESLERIPGHPLITHPLVLLLLRQGRTEEALATARRSAEARPEDVLARILLGAVALDAGDPATAEAEYRAAYALDPGHPAAGPGLAGVLTRKGALAEAESLLRELAGAAPERPDLSVLLADLILRRDPASEEATGMIEAALADDEVSAPVRLAGTHLLLRAHSRAGRLTRGRREAARFLGWWERQSRRDLDPRLVPALVASLAHAGALYQQAGSATLARRCYREALEHDPENVQALNNLAELLRESPDSAREAVAMAERATALRPEWGEVWDSLGRARLAAEDAKGATEAFAEAARRFVARGESGDARLLAETEVGAARARLLAGDGDAARAALERARKADPEIEKSAGYRTVEDSLR